VHAGHYGGGGGQGGGGVVGAPLGRGIISGGH